VPGKQGSLRHIRSTQCPLARWLARLHFLPLGFRCLAQAMPGMEASALPTSAPPINLTTLRRERVPLARPLASSSKERSPASGDIGYPFTKGPGLVSPAVLTNEAK
jgi:hypothetical protein